MLSIALSLVMLSGALPQTEPAPGQVQMGGSNRALKDQELVDFISGHEFILETNISSRPSYRFHADGRVEIIGHGISNENWQVISDLIIIRRSGFPAIVFRLTVRDGHVFASSFSGVPGDQVVYKNR